MVTISISLEPKLKSWQLIVINKQTEHTNKNKRTDELTNKQINKCVKKYHYYRNISYTHFLRHHQHEYIIH